MESNFMGEQFSSRRQPPQGTHRTYNGRQSQPDYGGQYRDHGRQSQPYYGGQYRDHGRQSQQDRYYDDQRIDRGRHSQQDLYNEGQGRDQGRRSQQQVRYEDHGRDSQYNQDYERKKKQQNQSDLNAYQSTQQQRYRQDNPRYSEEEGADHHRKQLMEQSKKTQRSDAPGTDTGYIIEQMRAVIMSRGVHGIKSFGRMFRLYDDNRDKKLVFNEFKTGIRDYGMKISDEALRAVFNHFDVDGTGSISFDELLNALRPPLSNARRKLIDLAFMKLDRTGDGVITVDDLKQTYNVSKHPKYLSGEKTQKDILTEFLRNFEAPRDIDGRVTREEFVNYYTGVSNSIDKDVYFDLMMRQAWDLK